MRNFTDKTENFEEMPVYIAIKDFFDSFFVERNYQKMLSLMTDDFEGIGTVEESVVRDKSEFVLSLKTELAIMTREISYEIESISAKDIREYDIVIITAAHSKFDYEMIQKNAKAIFDTRNAMKNIENRENIELL